METVTVGSYTPPKWSETPPGGHVDPRDAKLPQHPSTTPYNLPSFPLALELRTLGYVFSHGDVLDGLCPDCGATKLACYTASMGKPHLRLWVERCPRCGYNLAKPHPTMTTSATDGGSVIAKRLATRHRKTLAQLDALSRRRLPDGSLAPPAPVRMRRERPTRPAPALVAAPVPVAPAAPRPATALDGGPYPGTPEWNALSAGKKAALTRKRNAGLTPPVYLFQECPCCGERLPRTAAELRCHLEDVHGLPRVDEAA